MELVDSSRSIFLSAQRFFSGTMLSRVTGLIRDITMAYAFGAHPSIAALMVSYRLAYLFRRILGEGALQTAFIPQFEKLKKESESRALDFFRGVKQAVSLILVLLISLAGTIGLLLLNSGTLSEGNGEIILYTLMLLPSLFFICLFGINSALLYTHGFFFVSGAAPVACNVIWIAAAWNLRNLPIHEAMPWLAASIAFATICQWAITIPSVRSIEKGRKPEAPYRDLKELGKPFTLAVIGVAAMQVNGAIDPLFARYANAEGPAWLWYAFRVQHLPIALISVSLSYALLPALSRASGHLVRYTSLLQSALKQSLSLSLPISAFLIVLGGSALQLLFGRGDFDSSATDATYLCLAGYSLGIVFNGMILLMAPAYYAMSDYRRPMIASSLSMLVNAALNALLILFFGFGAASVAFATSASSLINFLILRHGLKERLAHVTIDPWLLIFTIMASIAASAVQYLLLGAIPLLSLWGSEPFLYPSDFQHQITTFILPSIVFCLSLTPFYLSRRAIFLSTTD